MRKKLCAILVTITLILGFTTIASAEDDGPIHPMSKSLSITEVNTENDNHISNP